MTLTRDQIENDIPSQDILEKQCVEHRRWYSIQRLVFRYEGAIYEARIERPLTEVQEMAHDDEDEIECVEVQRREMTAVVYEKLPA